MPQNTDLVQAEKLASLVTVAEGKLFMARTAAEVLDATSDAKAGYDAVKAGVRLAKAKGAHDEVIEACWRTLADLLVIEAQAQCRIADEYDAAQERGEVQAHGGQGRRDVPEQDIPPSVTDIGLTRKVIHEARKVRDAERDDPGIVRRTVDAKLAEGEAPTRADVRRATGADAISVDIVTESTEPREVSPTIQDAPPRSEWGGMLGNLCRDIEDERTRETIERAARQVAETQKRRQPKPADDERVSPMEKLKRQYALLERKHEELKAKHETSEGSLFDLKRDTPDNIAAAIIANVTEHKAREIVAAMNKRLKKPKPSG
jgi:hypothetical protein